MTIPLKSTKGIEMLSALLAVFYKRIRRKMDW
jgi:hypothetical protein